MSDSVHTFDSLEAAKGANRIELAAQNTLALAFATIERPQVAQRLIRSVRRRFPTMPIYVADQSLDVTAMTSFYTQMNVKLIRMPYDAGVCASRNLLAAEINEDFFVLCDDDFVFGARTEFADALRILNHHSEIGVIGGKLYDYNGKDEYTRNWELYLNLDVVNRTLTSIPIYHYAPRAREIGATRFYMCDAVMNFSVMRRKIFDQPTIRWDERFKSNGEHEDFFLNMKLNSDIGVAYLPTMVAYHHHPEQFLAYRSRLRDRLDGWKKLFDKWSIDQHLEIGLGVRSIDNLNSVVTSEDATARFFLNKDLSLRRGHKAGALLVSRDSRVNFVGLVDESGEPDLATPDMARLVVDSGTGLVSVASDAEVATDIEHRLEPDMCETPQLRHSLVPSGTPVDYIGVSKTVLFRYNPIFRSEADFILWYRVVRVDQEQEIQATCLSGTFIIHLRWFADDDRILTWQSGGYFLDSGRTEYWVPMLIEVPMCPSNCAYMRFEVVTGEANSRRRLATGFLFSHPPAKFAADRGLEVPALDALALTPWAWPYANDVIPPLDLDDLPTVPAAERMEAGFCTHAPSLMLLPTANFRDLHTVFVFGWPGLGSSLSIIHRQNSEISSADASFPQQIALPRRAATFLQIVGFVEGEGYRQIALS